MIATILLADDNAGNREVARLTLEAVGYRVVEASNGWEALELARKERPSLFILDIQMPLLDGYGVVGQLRREKDFAGTPAIALTAFAMQGDEEKALAAGFTRYISKPLNIKELRRIVAELLS